MAVFDAPKTSELGWFGGCGDIVCTGKRNYLIEDHDGGLTGTSGGGTFIPSNPEIGNALDGCTAVGGNVNGHFCADRHDLAILEYESIHWDHDLRIMWPVTLTRNAQGPDQMYSHQTNGYKEWEWDGNEPLNRRNGRFISIVNVNSTYNMSFISEPPHTMKLQLQKRVETGNPDDWMIVKLHYPRPNAIRVYTKNRTSSQNDKVENAPLPVITGADNQIRNVTDDLTECGRNIYYHHNYTTHFLITGAQDCQVIVALVSTIRLTARFEMPIEDFYTADGETKLVDRMAALLQISDASRIKIVGVASGSTVVNVDIDAVQPAANDDGTTPNQGTTADEIVNLQAENTALQGIINDGSFAADLTANGLTGLISASTEVMLVPEDEEVVDSDGDGVSDAAQVGMIVGIVIGSIAVILVAVFTFVMCRRRRAKISHEELDNLSSDDADKPKVLKDMIEEDSVNYIEEKKKF